MSVESLFLEFSVEKLGEFGACIEVCLGKLNEDGIWTRGRSNENAVGNLVLHLTGNVRQWIISALGNNPDHRDRASEFDARGGYSAAELLENLRNTLEQAGQIISGLTTAQLTRMYEIQKNQISGVEAVYHVVEHFSQHTGQIILGIIYMISLDSFRVIIYY